MSRSYRVVAVATAIFAALLTASVFLWLSARANAAETKGDDEPIKEVRVVTVKDDGNGANVIVSDGDPDKKTQVYVVRKGGDSESSAFLGVQLSEETKHKDGGARVDEVVSDSPAEKAGLKQNDIIVSFGGQAIHGPMRLSESIHAAKPGEKVDIEVIRDGARKKIQVEMGERPKGFAYWFGDEGKGYAPLPDMESFQGLEGLKDLPGMFQWKLFGNRPKLGIRVVETTPDLREHLGATRDAGVLVGKVMPGTPAEKAGLKVGDMIVSIDGDQVASAGSLVEALADKDGKTVDLEVIRDRKTMHLNAPIPEAKEVDDEDSGPQAYYFRTPPPPPPAPAPPAPPASPRALTAPPAPAPPAPPAPAEFRDVVKRQAEIEAAVAEARSHAGEAARLARDLSREDRIAAELLAERGVARELAKSRGELARQIQSELQAAMGARDSLARAEIERQITDAVRAGHADALRRVRETSEKVREELRHQIEGLEVY